MPGYQLDARSLRSLKASHIKEPLRNLFALALGACLTVQAAPGDLDPTFGVAGSIHFGFGGVSDVLHAAALAPDGKIVVVGQTELGNDGAFAVARYLTDGSLDPSFGGNGIVLTNIVRQISSNGSPVDTAEGVRLQADGKIVVAGTAGETNEDQDFAIVRYQPDGSIDPSFGPGGLVRTDFSGQVDRGTALAAQTDGKWIVAGTAQGNLALARYHADGALDTSFGAGGKVILAALAASFGTMRAPDLVLQADGKILLATSPSTVGAFLLVRLNADGTLDPTFGNNGAAVIGVNSGLCTAVAIQPGNSTIGLSDRILAAGSSANGTRRVYTAMRFDLNGTLDPSFGSGGIQTTDVSAAGGTQTCNAVLVDPTGPINRRIYLAGTDGANKMTVIRYSTNGALDTSFNGTGIAIPNFSGEANALIRSGSGGIVAVGQTSNASDFALARFAADGALDPGFDLDGWRADDAGGGIAFAASMALQPDGRLVLAGVSPGFSVARLNPDGRLDGSFAQNGKLRPAFASTRLTEARAVTVQADGKLLVAGVAIQTDRDFAVARLHPDGSLDSSFDGDGVAITNMGPGTDLAQALALQGDGKILLAGRAFNGFNHDVALARYHANGSLDSTFDLDGRLTLDLGAGDDEVHAMALQPDGKIVIAGFAVDGPKKFLLARLNPNGSLDATFGQDGVVRSAIGTEDAEINAIALAPNGDIVVTGTLPESIQTGAEAHFVVARYHANGTLDLSFDGDGISTFPAGHLPAGQAGGHAIVLQANGRIVIAGAEQTAPNFLASRFTLLRFNANGALDASFGTGGKKTVPFALGVDGDSAQALSLDPAGRIVVAGQADQLFGIARLEGDRAAPAISAVVSRKMHGGANTFDIALPLTGNPGIECRSGGAGNAHQIVLTFVGPVTYQTASITSGTGSVASSSGSGTDTLTVNLIGVPSVQTINLRLAGVSNGFNTGDVNVPMAVLLGDTNGNRTVNASDIGQTKSQSGQPVSASNFRSDLNANGSINATDISLGKAQSGATLP